MSWLSEVVRPKLQELVGGIRPVPDHLWHKCPSCGQMVFHRELEKNLRVCQHCDHHLRLGARQRLAMLFDDGACDPVEIPKTPADPLKFRDLKRYSERLKEAHAKTGEADALLVATGLIGGLPAVMAVLDFAFMGGSMGVAVGEGLLTAARRAVERQASLIVITASGGARMQEGILSLMQMARTTIAVAEVRAARLPYLVVLTDPTTGGVSASFAMLGDVTLAEPGAVVGFAGARVIQQTIRESLPDGFQRAEYLQDHGMIDMVVHRHRLRDALVRLLSLLMKPQDPLPAAGRPEPPQKSLPAPESAAAQSVLPVPAVDPERAAE
jgi:acetyl-CoA carboxylase carboxyl transferase subunit beta